MAGGKGKSTGGKAGPKEAAGKTQKSHSAKAGLQVSSSCSKFRQPVECIGQQPGSRVVVAVIAAESLALDAPERQLSTIARHSTKFYFLCDP